MPDTERREAARDLSTLGAGGDREPLAQAAAARVDSQLTTRLGIHKPE